MIQFELKRKPISMTIHAGEALPMTAEKAIVVSGIRYEGEYLVTPTVSKQTLPTQYKTLHKDLVVEAIPFVETANNFGGTTVVIG